MEIFYLGQACFKIKTKEVTVIIDPFDPKFEADLSSTKGGFEADIVCVTQGMKGLKGINQGREKEIFVIDGPGEYEVKGVTVFGIPAETGGKNESKEQITLYSLEVEDFTLAHLGSIGQKLNDEQVSELEGVDVLMVPVGGVTSIDPKKAAEIVGQLTPTIVIPMYDLDSVEVKKFCDEMEIEAPEAVEKLKLKSRADLPEETEVILLSRGG